jgi:hypothetical protein
MNDEAKGQIKQAIPQQGFSPLGWVIVALVFFAVAGGLFYAANNPELPDGLQKLLIYLVLILASMAFAAFIFGSMRSYATLKGERFGGKWELGGPVAGAAFILLSGAYFLGILENGGGTGSGELNHLDMYIKYQPMAAAEAGGANFPALTYKQHKPVLKRNRYLAANPAGIYELPNVDLPKVGERYIARMRRTVYEPEANPVNLTPAELCFDRHDGVEEQALQVSVICMESSGCVVDPIADQEWFSICDQEQSWLQWLIGSAYAQEITGVTGWAVPSLAILKQRNKTEGMSYTAFTIQSDPLTAYPDANALEYEIRVNGVPVFIDGWQRVDTRVPLEAQQGVAFEFGLENLNFAGADQGREQIEVSFYIYHNDELLDKLSLARSYVALREVEPITRSENGVNFDWTGEYVIGKAQEGFEVFVWSTTDPTELMKRKRWFDNSRVSYQGRPAVAVIRPPLGANPYYGLAIGLIDSIGRVQFTFSESMAKGILSWVKTDLLSKRYKDTLGYSHLIVRQDSRIERLKGY